MADGWIELFDVETDEVELLFVFDRFEPVDYGCGVFPLVEVVFFRDCAVDSDSQRMTSKRDTETTPHHSATPNTQTPPNSASISGPSKTTTSNTLFPGAFSHRTRRTTAQAKDVTSASKKNC